jgi:hypothetical protein
MIGRSRVRSVPVEFAIGLIDRKIVNGCVTMLHETGHHRIATRTVSRNAQRWMGTAVGTSEFVRCAA